METAIRRTKQSLALVRGHSDVDRRLRADVARLTAQLAEAKAEREEAVAHLTREYEANRDEWIDTLAKAERETAYAVKQAADALAEVERLRGAM